MKAEEVVVSELSAKNVPAAFLLMLERGQGARLPAPAHCLRPFEEDPSCTLPPKR